MQSEEGSIPWLDELTPLQVNDKALYNVYAILPFAWSVLTFQQTHMHKLTVLQKMRQTGDFGRVMEGTDSYANGTCSL